MPGSPATPTTRPLDRRDQRWLPHNAGKSVPPPPRRYRGWPARNPPRAQHYCGCTTNTRAVKQPQPPRSLESAAFPQRATAHTVGRSGRPSCIVAAQYISLRLDDTSCVRAEIEPYARCAAIRGESTRNRTTSSIAAASVNGLPSALCVLEFPDTAACCAKPSPRPSCPRGLGRCNILMRFRAMIS
jgi:hypothetical protein